MTAITVYATLAQFQTSGLPSTAITGITDDDITSILAIASDLVSDACASQYQLPFTQIGNSITQVTIDIAGGIILDRLGEAPLGESFKTWSKRAEDAKAYLDLVAARKRHFANCVDSAVPANIQPGPQALPLASPWNPGALGG